MKARIFLHYDKLLRLFILAGITFIAAAVFHIFYVMYYLPPEWFNLDLSKGNFVPFGIYLLVVYWAILYFCVTVYFMLRDVK